MTMDVTPLYAEIGERVRLVRTLAGMTQDDLARTAAMTRTTITNLESGKQKVVLESLYLIARALDIPIYFLIPEDVRSESVPR
jgi:transcriptional regulator with XRE-family HTH domain